VAEKKMDESVRRTLPGNVTVTHVTDNFGLISGKQTSVITRARKQINRLLLNIKIALKIMRIDRTENIDALETTNYYYLCLTYSFLPNRKPLITRFSSTTAQLRHYGNWRTSRVDIIEQLEFWMFKRSAVKLTHTHAHGKLIADQMNLPQKEIVIIPHGTSIQGNKEVAAPGNMDRGLRLLFLGRLETRKGIQTILASLPELVSAYPRIQFRIAGADEDGVYRKWFSEKYPELSANVNFLGEISDQDKVIEYQACDIFVAPSLYESFGLIYIEADRVTQTGPCDWLVWRLLLCG
jgi:glycosyltransferase involved in cell wall biosynthesis